MRNFAYFSSFMLVVIAAGTAGAMKVPTYPTENLECPCPQILAHRGASGDYPESTILAFEKALEMGTDILEMDVHRSKDGHLIVNHDGDLSETTGDSRDIEDLTLAQIKALDAGYEFTKDGGSTHPWRGKGLQVATLPEVIAAFPGQRLNIEMKVNDDRLADSLWSIISANQMEAASMVASQHTGVMNHFRDISNGDVNTSATIAELTGATLAFGFGFGWTIKPKFQAVQMPYDIATTLFVNFFKKKGVIVHMWTVNDSSKIKKAFDMGADGVIGDYPDRIYAELVRRGDR